MKKLKLFAVTSLTILGLSLISAERSYAVLSSDGAMSLSIGAGSYILNDLVMKSAIKGTSKKSTSTKKSSTTKKSSKSNTSSTVVKNDTTKFKSTNSTRGLDNIVSFYPANQRNDIRSKYQKIYNSFPQVAKSLGIPTNDLATGLAALLAGSYTAYNNVTLNDSYMKPLTDQLRTALINTGGMGNMSDSEKQYMYDQMVMLGLTMAVSQLELQKNPNAKSESEMRRVGKEFLEKMFNVNASRVKITASGLVVN